MYVIEPDLAAGILRVTLSGFWSAATLQAFAGEMMAAATRLRAVRPDFALLSDSADFPVQAADVASGFEAMMTAGARFSNGPVAIVVGSTLNKMQAERALASARTRVFLSMEEASAWLAEQGFKA